MATWKAACWQRKRIIKPLSLRVVVMSGLRITNASTAGGDICALKMVSLMISEWMAATPLTALLPTTARYAMFTSLRHAVRTTFSTKLWEVWHAIMCIDRARHPCHPARTAPQQYTLA